MSSGCLHTPRHLQGVWDWFPQKESPEQCRPDVCTLPDTSRACGTGSPGRNLWSNVIRMSAHSQTPPGRVGPVPPEGISRAMSSRCLHTPRHLQGMWDQFLQKESLQQCRLDVCTLPDTSTACGTSSSRRNLRSNVVWMPEHPQPLQGMWDQFLQKEPPQQCRLDICTLPDTSRECGTSSSGRQLWSNVLWTFAHSQTPLGHVGPVPLEGISGAMSSRHLHTPRHLQGVWDQFPQTTPPEN